MSGAAGQTIPVRLRPITPDDAREMTRVLGDPALYDFIGGEPPTGRSSSTGSTPCRPAGAQRRGERAVRRRRATACAVALLVRRPRDDGLDATGAQMGADGPRSVRLVTQYHARGSPGLPYRLGLTPLFQQRKQHRAAPAWPPVIRPPSGNPAPPMS